jgi:hypothetical protein
LSFLQASKRPDLKKFVSSRGIEVLLLDFENIINGLYRQPEASNPHHTVFF